MKIFRFKVKPRTKTTKDYKTPIKEIISYSSLAFLLSPIKSKRLFIKIIWILFLFVLLFVSIYYVVLEVLNYLQYETTTSIYEILEQESEFPTISICNMINSNFDVKILELWFQNEDLTDEWQNHIESFTDSDYGKCFRLNSGLNLSSQSILIKKARKSGLDQGLWLDIYSNTSHYYEALMIHIDNHTRIPANIYNKGFVILPRRNENILRKNVYICVIN